MKRLIWGLGATLLAGTQALAQSTSIQVLEQDLQQAKTQHDAASSQQMVDFVNALDAASQNPNTALDLYQKAGGELPDPTPINKHYAYETPSEKAQREALDQQNLTTFATVAQVHCGLMKNAALLASKPLDPKVNADWIEWLKNAATLYPQLAGRLPLKNATMKDSVIARYFGFHGWGASEQGTWSIQQLPALYRQFVLDPLRNPPGPGTLDAWNTYITMVRADDPDPNHFAQTTEPALDFDRAADDFAIRPTMDKLQLVDQIIKANPMNDHMDNWITRAQQMIARYTGGATHSPLPGATPGSSDSSTYGSNPGATPGTASSGTTAPTPTASPGATSSGTTAPTPTASPGITPAGTGAPLPVASPGITPSGSAGTLPTASPGITSSGGTAPLPTASPGTPSSGGGSPTPTATP